MSNGKTKIIELYSPMPHQKAVHDGIAKYGFKDNHVHVVLSRRQCGKSLMLMNIVLKVALEKPGTTSFIVSPAFNQSVDMFENILNSLEDSMLIKKADAKNFTLKLFNNSMIRFLSAGQRERLRGKTCSGILCIDEAAFISDDIFHIIVPYTNVHETPIVLVSTPLFTEGFFYNSYVNGISNKSKRFHSYNFSDYDLSALLSDEILNEYKKQLPSNVFTTEYLGEFIKDKSMVFGDFKANIKTPINKAIEYIGIDWSNGTGGDSTVVTGFNNNGEQTYLWESNITQPNDLVEELAKFINDTKTIRKILVEENSIGKVYFDILRKKLNDPTRIESFVTTNESKREIIEQLISAFKTHEITILDDKQLHLELSYFGVTKTKTGYTYQAPQRSGYHDDYVMSLAIGYHCFKNNLKNKSRIRIV